MHDDIHTTGTRDKTGTRDIPIGMCPAVSRLSLAAVPLCPAVSRCPGICPALNQEV